MRTLLIILLLIPAFAWADSTTAWPARDNLGTNWTNPSNATGSGPDDNCADYASGQDWLCLHATGVDIPDGDDPDSLVIYAYIGGDNSLARKREMAFDITLDSTNTEGLTISAIAGPQISVCSDIATTYQRITFDISSYTEAQVESDGFGLLAEDNDAGSDQLFIDAAWFVFYSTTPSAGGYQGQIITIGGD